jgi:3-hydroxypropanoate dehydrogenase
MGPTSANINPARFVFLRSAAAKERLRPSLAPGNVEKTMSAPVTVIVAYDLKFYEKLPRLFPHYPAMRDMFMNNPQLIEETAKRNSALQGAYMIIAARGAGTGLRSDVGIRQLKLDEEFFSTGKCEECEQSVVCPACGTIIPVLDVSVPHHWRMLLPEMPLLCLD